MWSGRYPSPPATNAAPRQWYKALRDERDQPPLAAWLSRRRCGRARLRLVARLGATLPRRTARSAGPEPAVPQAPGRHRDDAEDQARRRADDGEPHVRQHPRDARPRGAPRGAARSTASRSASAASRELQPRPRRPQGVRGLRQLAVPAVRRADPDVERVAPVLRQGRQQRLREGVGSGRDALLRPAADAVQLLAGRATSRSASGTSARSSPRPIRTAASCSPAPRRG